MGFGGHPELGQFDLFQGNPPKPILKLFLSYFNIVGDFGGAWLVPFVTDLRPQLSFLYWRRPFVGGQCECEGGEAADEHPQNRAGETSAQASASVFAAFLSFSPKYFCLLRAFFNVRGTKPTP